MNVYIENFHMRDLLSENEKPCKPLSPLHVSGVMDERFFQHEKIKKIVENESYWTIQQHSTRL